MNGSVEVVNDVPKRYAEIVAAEVRARSTSPFRLACSAGTSGKACAEALVSSGVDLSRIDLYFADERCVDDDSPDRNANTIAEALGGTLRSLAGFHPMSCAAGPESYERLLRQADGIDLVQLGMGPDGHTASLFPDSPALDAIGVWVTGNHDPSGSNAYERLTLTFDAIATANHVVITVIGAGRRDALQAIVDGKLLPAAQVRAKKLTWLVDSNAADGIEGLTKTSP